MKKWKFSFVAGIFSFFIFVHLAIGGTTGKITGTITDKASGDPLPGANVILAGSTTGAAADIDGDFTILHVSPGVYSVVVSMMGYAKVVVSDVRVRIDQTTRVDVQLEMEAIEGETVTVVAEKNLIRQDISTSVVAISSDEVQEMPLSSVSDVVELQAGIQNGLEIRGGGADEALLQVDGVTLRDPRNNQPISGVALSAVKEISIERGGFNAEYGQVRSGLVNIVTKEGSKSVYHGTATFKYSPPQSKSFGISPYDKNSMWLRPYLDNAVCWTGTNNWDYYTRSQYPEFRGWDQVAIERLTDTDLTNDITPAAAQRLFTWEHRKRPVTDQPDYNIDAGLGGPVPLIGEKLGNLRFFASYRQEREMLLVPLARDDYLDYDFQIKLNSDISSAMKLSLNGLFGKNYNVAINDDDERFFGNQFGPTSLRDVETLYWQPTMYMKTPFQIAKVTQESRPARIFSNSFYCPADVSYHTWAAKLSHTLSQKTFYEISVEYLSRTYKTGPVANRSNQLYEIIAPTSPLPYTGWVPSEPGSYFGGYWADESPFGFRAEPAQSGIGGSMGVFNAHTSEARDSSQIAATTFKIDLTSQINRSNMIKAGVEFVYNDLHLYYGVVNEAVGQILWVNEHYFPVRGALYIQDKLEPEGLGFVINMGLRMDFSNANTHWVMPANPFDESYYSAKYNPDASYSAEKTKTDFSISPRLGISYPITENSKLFFNYGHFKQLPTYEEMLRLGRDPGAGAMRNYGNPNLLLAKTVSYELGYDHVLFNTLLVQAAAFYHDITDQQSIVSYVNKNESVNYSQASNNSYEDIRGFELSLRKSAGQWWSGFANYTYQVNTSGYFGKQNMFEKAYEQRVEDQRTRNLYQKRPIPQPFARVSLVFNSPRDFGPDVYGIRPLGDWALNFIYNWRAGEYIDWNPYNDPDVYANVQVKDYNDLVLRVNKTFTLTKMKMKLTCFVEVNNLFNIKRLSGASFEDILSPIDYIPYMQSLHLPKSEDYDNIPGSDRAGEYRKNGVAFQPIVQVSNINDITKPGVNDPYVIYWEIGTGQYLHYDRKTDNWIPVPSKDMKKILDDKAYIDMPNQTSFSFLNPRQWFFGVRLSFDLQ